jgi:hypothetical protein
MVLEGIIPTHLKAKVDFSGNTDVGCREEVSITAVYDWNFTNPCQWV